MIIPRELLPEFTRWVGKALGCAIRVREKARRGELGRFMWGPHFVVIREINCETETESPADSVEVYTSDPVHRNEIEKQWDLFLHAKVLEGMADDGILDTPADEP